MAAISAAEEISGPGRQLAAIARGLADVGADVRVFQLWRRGHELPPFIGYLQDHGVSSAVVEDRGPLDVGLPARVRKALNDWKPDILQSHGYKASAIAWTLRHTGTRLPWIGFFHGSTTESVRASLYHWIDHRLLSDADRIVVMSKKQAGAFARAEARVRVIYNAVISLPQSHDSMVTALPFDAPPPRLAVVGRLSPEKGIDLFLRACAILRDRKEAFHAWVAGDGPERLRLEYLAHELGLGECVTFLGSVRRMRDLYRSIDLLVIPSRSEGLPNVLLEALGNDVPIVATDVGAISDVLTDPRGGLVIPPESVHALADGISTALRECVGPKGSGARAEMARRFSFDERLLLHRCLYDEVLASGEVRRRRS